MMVTIEFFEVKVYWDEVCNGFNACRWGGFEYTSDLEDGSSLHFI